MKRILLLCGQGSESYGEKIVCRKTTELLETQGVNVLLPKSLKDALRDVVHCDGIVFAGRRRGSVDAFDVLNIALEFGKSIFLFGIVLGDMRERELRHFSTILMSSKVNGFVTDEISCRWARLWSGGKIERGVDLVHAFLLEDAKREKSKFAVFAPRFDGTLKKYGELKWLPKMDTRIIVANRKDSKAAVELSRNLNTEEIIIISEPADITQAIANAKFVVSERFHVSITALSYGVPFIHVGNRSVRYFGKALSHNFSPPDEIEIALSFSRILENMPENYEHFNEEAKRRFKVMVKKLYEFVKNL